MYLALAVVVAGCSTASERSFSLAAAKCALPARPAAPSPHHRPRAAVCRAGVVAPAPTHPHPAHLPLFSRSPLLSPLLLEQEATMKSALLVSSLLMGAQAFTPTLPLNNAFVQRQAARAEPARATRGRGGESVYGCGWAGCIVQGKDIRPRGTKRASRGRKHQNTNTTPPPFRTHPPPLPCRAVPREKEPKSTPTLLPTSLRPTPHPSFFGT